MRLDDYRTSDNVGDERGESFGGGMGGGGGLFPLVFGLVASRFGFGGILVLIVAALIFGGNPMNLMGGGGNALPGGRAPISKAEAAHACTVDAASKFSCQVLASTEDSWSRIFAAQGQHYAPAGLIFYSNTGASGCGAAQAAMGPFYCPTDQRIYLDTGFYNELKTRFGAPGDFAEAYVIAHEVGHHVQDLLGILPRVTEEQQSLSPAQANALQVKIELQADCFAGVWAAQNRNLLDPGDVEEGLRAAHAIGDDTLQKETQGRVVPDSFTHGTSAQRMAWLKRGIDSGDPAQCDTFAPGADA